MRFASDDLYDCGWEATHEFTVPVSAKSGLYCGRATFEIEGKPKVSFVTFIVKKNRDRAKAPILVLCSSNTWLAYNSTPFSVNLDTGEKWNASTAGGVNSHPLAPTYSCYLDHRFGQPSYQFGLRMPWPIAGPNVWYSAPEVGYSHLMRGERFTHVWLDENNYDYDVIADVDLHREPDLLDGYATVLINGHSEYWSIDAWQGLDKYLRHGGTAIVFSGNTMFWRVSFNQDCSIMECRKLDDRIGGRAHANIGELFHQQDGKRGSLMRECGWPAWKLVGLECDGWGGVGPDDFGVYFTELPDHFLFREPERVELAKAATFGHAPGGGFPKAIGHEWDVRVPRLNSMTRTVPPQASLPDEPAGIVTLARGVRKQTEALDYFTQATSAPDGTVAEMIYWERPEGGRVFHGGAIGVGWALSADPKLQTLIRNVLHHFGVKPG
ncbi:MAG: N,N-dimethylformamidase beta subunit family domain-containing protein [Pirellulaceae bacterium]